MTSEARGYPQRQERLATTIAEVTPQWLTKLLRNRYPDITVESMRELQRVSGPSIVMRLAITVSGAGSDQIPSQVCLKATLAGGYPSNIINVTEARFYKNLAHRLSIPAPACFYADWDDDEEVRQGLIILEDMTTWDGEISTATKPISVEDAMKSVEALADLHGTTWDSPLLEQDWLQTSMAPETVMDDYWTLLKNYVEVANSRPDRLAILPDWAARDPMKMREAWLRLRDHELGLRGPRCVVHGDLHLGNTYRKFDGSRLFFDWQIVRKGRPWRDYTYFVVGSLTTEDRRRTERQLLQHYLGRLAEHGVNIPLVEAWDEYRRWVIWGLVSWHVAGETNVVESTPAALERFCKAASDFRVDEMFGL